MAESKLFKYFAAKHVNIIMKNIKGSQAMSDGSVVRGNIVIDGYLLDEDTLHYYVGTAPEEVNEALLKTDVVRIFTSDPEGPEYVEIDLDDHGDRH